MQKEIIIQNSYNNIMNTYKKILLILVLVLITIIIQKLHQAAAL